MAKKCRRCGKMLPKNNSSDICSSCRRTNNNRWSWIGGGSLGVLGILAVVITGGKGGGSDQ